MPADVGERRLDAAVGRSVQQSLERRPRGRQVAPAVDVRETGVEDAPEGGLERLVGFHPVGLRALGRIDRAVEDERTDAVGVGGRVALGDDRPVAHPVDRQTVDAERRADRLDIAGDVLGSVGRQPCRVDAGLHGAPAREVRRERGRGLVGLAEVLVEVPRALAQLGATRPTRIERQDVVLAADWVGEPVDEVVRVQQAALARTAVDEQERAELLVRGRRDRVRDLERGPARVRRHLVALHGDDVASRIDGRARPPVARALGGADGDCQGERGEHGDHRAAPRDRRAAPRDGDPTDRRDRHGLAVLHVVHEPEGEPRRRDSEHAAQDRPGRGHQDDGQGPGERPHHKAGDEDDEGGDGQHEGGSRQAAPGGGPRVIPGRGLAIHPGRGEQEVAAHRVHDAEPGQHREIRSRGPAPDAPHPERHHDRRQQPDPERAGQPFELGRLRDGDEVRVEVLGQDGPGADRDQERRRPPGRRPATGRPAGAGRRGSVSAADRGARSSRSARGRGRPAPGSSRR